MTTEKLAHPHEAPRTILYATTQRRLQTLRGENDCKSTVDTSAPSLFKLIEIETMCLQQHVLTDLLRSDRNRRIVRVEDILQIYV